MNINRYNVMASVYVKIANENYLIAIDKNEICKSIENNCSKFNFGSPEYDCARKELMDVENDRDEKSLICIVFVGMALEAFIFDYSARHFSNSYVKNHLDKLDLTSKYLVIPKLASGKEINRDGQAFQMLKEFVSVRNRIVHSKSKPLDSIDKLIKELDETDYFKYAKNSMELLRLISTELDEIDNEARAIFLLGI